jgi:hypothetical protein
VHETSAHGVLNKSTAFMLNKSTAFMLNKYLAGAEGLEPAHAGIKIRCLNQLGDAPTLVFGQNFAIETASFRPITENFIYSLNHLSICPAFQRMLR